jgi:molybdenum storage protein
LQNSEVLEKIQIINGLEKGNLTKALAGKPVGTIIYKS